MFRACLVSLLLFSASQVASAQVRTLDPDVEKVLRERLALLREIVAAEKSRFAGGTISEDAVIFEEQLVVEAELELAKTAAERIRAREAQLRLAEKLEAIFKEQHDRATVSTVELRKAQVKTLRAKADLLQERKSLPQ